MTIEKTEAQVILWQGDIGIEQEQVTILFEGDVIERKPRGGSWDRQWQPPVICPQEHTDKAIAELSAAFTNYDYRKAKRLLIEVRDGQKVYLRGQLAEVAEKACQQTGEPIEHFITRCLAEGVAMKEAA